MSGLEQRDLTRVAPKAIVSRSSFYRALSILPREKREAMYEVYAFCRAVDDIADDGGLNDDRIAMLNHWREDIARLYAGGGPSELTEGLARPVQAFGLRREDFLAIIDGMRMGFTRFGMYMVLFHCRAIGGELTAHPLETSGVGWFAEDALPEPLAGADQWRPLAFAAIRGEDVGVHYDAPRDQPWSGPAD